MGSFIGNWDLEIENSAMWTSCLTGIAVAGILPFIALNFFMVSSQSYVTKEGLQRMREELDEARNIRRKEVAERIERAKEMGDLSENAEYTSAREEQAFLEGRILELETLLRNAVVISHAKGTDSVEVGSIVKAQSSDGGVREYTIVGSDEADPLKGKISHASPLGEAFLDKRVADVVEVHAPKGIIRYTILSIE